MFYHNQTLLINWLADLAFGVEVNLATHILKGLVHVLAFVNLKRPARATLYTLCSLSVCRRSRCPLFRRPTDLFMKPRPNYSYAFANHFAI